jgi:hypothetical protein
MGKSVIQDGKVDGDNVSFSITVKVQDNEMKLDYKGKVTGDTIKFQVQGANGIQLEYNTKRIS